MEISDLVEKFNDHLRRNSNATGGGVPILSRGPKSIKYLVGGIIFEVDFQDFEYYNLTIEIKGEKDEDPDRLKNEIIAIPYFGRELNCERLFGLNVRVAREFLTHGE
ncbi:MAG: hypothetical protein WC548_00930 [Candidatus Pacearchaeota archaeon]